LPYVWRVALALALTCPVDHFREFLACAFQEPSQLSQALPVVEGSAAGNGEEPGYFCGFTPERLELRRTPLPPRARGTSVTEELVSWISVEEVGATRTLPIMFQPGRGPAFPVAPGKAVSETSAKHLSGLLSVG